MLPQASSSYYLEQQRVAASVLAAAKRIWGSRPPTDFDAWFDANVDRLVALVVAGQQRAVTGSEEYVADVLGELGTPVEADATPIPEALVGMASDGRELDTLMYGSVITAKGKIAQGQSVSQAWQSGLHALMLRMQTQLADASRVATGLGITARKGVGYTRMLNPPSCSRCAILAGRFYRWNAGFDRHPGCDCRGIPCREDRAGDLRTDPQQYFESLSEPMQDKLFTKAGAQAIRDGADINQVVNARRGMSIAQVYGQQIATTTEGVTRRGVAYAAMRNAGYAQRQTDVKAGRYFRARTPRLMPESIYEIATDRDDALRLLKLNGYLTDTAPRRTAGSASAGAEAALAAQRAANIRAWLAAEKQHTADVTTWLSAERTYTADVTSWLAAEKQHLDDLAARQIAATIPAAEFTPAQGQAWASRQWPYTVEDNPFTDAEFEAIVAYSDDAYDAWNGGLRTDVKYLKNKHRKGIAALDSAIERADPVPEPVVVSRVVDHRAFAGIDRADAHELVGREFLDKGFMSTSVEVSEGRPDIGAVGQYVTRITVPAGTRGVYISADIPGRSALSHFGKAENELVIGRGSKIRVDRIDEPDDPQMPMTIHATLVGQNPEAIG